MAKKDVFKTAPGPTEVASWQSQIPSLGGTVTGSPDIELKAGASPEAMDLYNMPQPQRALIASALKKAGYNVPTNGTFGPKLLTAYLDAIGGAQLYAQRLNREFDPTKDLGEFLNVSAAEQDGGADGVSTTIYRQDLTDEALAKGINQVYQDLLGRGASKKELDKYSRRLRQELAKAENMGRTVTSTAGGVTTVTQRPGMDTQAFLYDELGGTDEAKKQQVFSFYDVFKQALGVA